LLREYRHTFELTCMHLLCRSLASGGHHTWVLIPSSVFEMAEILITYSADIIIF
jgi:hypothetical protein